MVQVIELPQQPSATGLAALGQVFQEAGVGYAQDKRAQMLRQQQLDDEARRRQNQLSDTQSSREFERTEFDYQQAAVQKASDLHSKGEFKQHIAQMLANNGYLDPDKLDDQAAIHVAWAAFQRDGLAQKYADLINHGYLPMDKIGDPQAVADAQAKAAAASAAAFGASADQKANAVADAAKLAKQHDQTVAQLSQMEAEASKDPALEQPSAHDVQNRAAQLARDANPGRAITPQLVAQQMQAAASELRDQAIQAQMQRTQQAKAVLPSLQRQAQSEGARLDHYEKMGIFANPEDGEAAPPAPASTLAPAAGGAPPAAAQQSAFAALTGKGAPVVAGAAPTPAPPPTGSSPTSAGGAGPDGFNFDQDPVQQMAADQAQQGRDVRAEQIAAPAQQAASEISDIENQLRAAFANPNKDPGLITSLQAKRQALLQKLKALRTAQATPTATLTPPPVATGSPTASPAFSDANGSAPTPPPAATWWQSPDSVPSPY